MNRVLPGASTLNPIHGKVSERSFHTSEYVRFIARLSTRLLYIPYALQHFKTNDGSTTKPFIFMNIMNTYYTKKITLDSFYNISEK